MPEGILIMGSSGAGKTTLGKLVASKLGYPYIDIDEYIWRQDTPVPFSEMYSKPEKISRLMGAVSVCSHFVMGGSMNSFHEHFDPFFKLVIHLHADAAIRVERVHERELRLFGDRILPGGDMYDEHQSFLTGVAGYDFNIGGSTLQQHEQWLGMLTCQILRLDGAHPLEENAKTIISAYQAL